MKLQNIIAFNNFYSSISSQKMPLTLAYKLNKILEAISKDNEFYQTELLKIFKDCVQEDENGQFKMTDDKENFVLIEDKISEFEERFSELCNIDVTFDEQLKLDSDAFEGIEITPIQLYQIIDFMK